MNSEFFGSLPFFVVLIAIWWFIVIQPQRKEEGDRKKMPHAIKNGARVVTASGIHGVVVGSPEKDSKTVVLKIAERTNVEFDRSAVSSVVGEKK